VRRALAVAALLGVILAAALVGLPPTPAAADGIEVQSQAAQNRFPDGVEFTVFVASGSEIASVRLRYQILPDGTTVFGRPQCTAGAAVNCSITVGGNASAFLVPGVDITYSWEIQDAAGQKLETPEARYTYRDDRFRWESMSEGNVTLYYYSGSEQSNRGLLRAARETIDRMSQIIGTTVDLPVKVWAYNSASEMRAAILSNRRIPPNANNPTTLGEVVYSDTALVSRDTQALDIVRHEVTHIVMRQATKGALGDPPAWLDEGTAVYAQNSLLPDETQALDLAIRRGRPLSIFSLSSSTLTQTDTSLFYAQAWSTVKYLIDAYGAAKFAQFIAAFRAETTNGALQKAYGLDQLGLENEWRRSVGLPQVTAGSATPRSSERPLPTIVPFGAGGEQGAGPEATPVGPGQGDTKPGEANDGGTGLGPAVIAGAAIAAAALLGGGALYLRRRKSP